MAKKFYREILGRIKFCNVCGKEFRPPVYGWRQKIVLCDVHIKDFHRKWNEIARAKWTPEQWKKNYQNWLTWVEKNKMRRREIALKSYHKRRKEGKKRVQQKTLKE